MRSSSAAPLFVVAAVADIDSDRRRSVRVLLSLTFTQVRQEIWVV